MFLQSGLLPTAGLLPPAGLLPTDLPQPGGRDANKGQQPFSLNSLTPISRFPTTRYFQLEERDINDKSVAENIRTDPQRLLSANNSALFKRLEENVTTFPRQVSAYIARVLAVAEEPDNRRDKAATFELIRNSSLAVKQAVAHDLLDNPTSKLNRETFEKIEEIVGGDPFHHATFLRVAFNTYLKASVGLANEGTEELSSSYFANAERLKRKYRGVLDDLQIEAFDKIGASRSEIARGRQSAAANLSIELGKK